MQTVQKNTNIYTERLTPTYSIYRSWRIRTVRLCHKEADSFCHHTEEDEASEMERLKRRRFSPPLESVCILHVPPVYISKSHLEGHCLLQGSDIFTLTQTHLLARGHACSPTYT